MPSASMFTMVENKLVYVIDTWASAAWQSTGFAFTSGERAAQTQFGVFSYPSAVISVTGIEEYLRDTSNFWVDVDIILSSSLNADNNTSQNVNGVVFDHDTFSGSLYSVLTDTAMPDELDGQVHQVNNSGTVVVFDDHLKVYAIEMGDMKREINEQAETMEDFFSLKILCRQEQQ